MPSATFVSPSSKPRRARSVADAVLAEAIEPAREAAVEAAGPGEVGEHIGVRPEDHRLVTHFFASAAPGYVGWLWAVTLARAPRSRSATVCEVSLLPGDGAIVAPAWVPWSDRLQPSDVGPHDVLPYVLDDERLVQGYQATNDDDADQLAIYELGLGRARVLSPLGREQAASRWYSGDRGPVKPPARITRTSSRERARSTPAQCSTCGFLMLMAGSLRTMFGVCSNEWSPDDGKVVSMDHGCGAHSETDVAEGPADWPENAPVIDELGIEVVSAEVAVEAEPDSEPDSEPEPAPERTGEAEVELAAEGSPAPSGDAAPQDSPAVAGHDVSQGSPAPSGDAAPQDPPGATGGEAPEESPAVGKASEPVPAPGVTASAPTPNEAPQPDEP